MGNSPNIAGMVNDADFQSLAPADKRAALGRLTGDKSFGDLSDAETMQFVSKFAKPTGPRIPGAPDGLPPGPGAPTPTSQGRMVPPVDVQPMQQTNVGTAVGMTGQPLMSMQPGLPAPAQVPENARAMQIGALAGSALVNPVATIGAVATGAVGAKAGKKTGKALGFGETGQELFGLGGGLLGGAVGGAAAGGFMQGAKKIIGNDVWTQKPDGTWAADPWAEALTFGTKIGKAVLDHLAPKPADDLAMADAYAAQRSVQQQAAKNALVSKVPLGPQAPAVDPEVAAQQQAQLLAQRGLQRQAARNALVAKSPIGPETPEGAAPGATPAQEPSRIVQPGSTPPAQKVTYQSVPREQLYKMAKMGDIQAGMELIRNPGKLELPPNFKYLIEETAKKMPWRNQPE